METREDIGRILVGDGKANGDAAVQTGRIPSSKDTGRPWDDGGRRPGSTGAGGTAPGIRWFAAARTSSRGALQAYSVSSASTTLAPSFSSAGGSRTTVSPE